MGKSNKEKKSDLQKKRDWFVNILTAATCCCKTYYIASISLSISVIDVLMTLSNATLWNEFYYEAIFYCIFCKTNSLPIVIYHIC